MTLRKKPFENIVGKGKYAGNQHFLLFPTIFVLPIKKEKQMNTENKKNCTVSAPLELLSAIPSFNDTEE